jgi:hypothetical protein
MLIPADGRFTTLLGHTSDEAGRPLRAKPAVRFRLANWSSRPEAGVRRDAQKQSSAVVRRRVLRDWAVHIVDRLNSHSEMSRKYKRLQLTRADYLV